MSWLGLRRPSRPEDIPKLLDAQALAQAMDEARFLMRGHGVDVRTLAPGEEPDIPKVADGSEEPPYPPKPE